MRRSIFAVLALVAASASAGAQAPGRDTATAAAAYRPPPGMCRVWLDAVKPSDQPAPTDCATAVRNRPANGRVIFGERVPPSHLARTPACTTSDSSCAASPDCAKVRALAGCSAEPFGQGGVLKGLLKRKKP